VSINNKYLNSGLLLLSVCSMLQHVANVAAAVWFASLGRHAQTASAYRSTAHTQLPFLFVHTCWHGILLFFAAACSTACLELPRPACHQPATAADNASAAACNICCCPCHTTCRITCPNCRSLPAISILLLLLAMPALLLVVYVTYVMFLHATFRTTCPNCLSLPAISLLQKISNHLDLVRPDARLRDVDERQVGDKGSVRQRHPCMQNTMNPHCPPPLSAHVCWCTPAATAAAATRQQGC
jgi:hypothetical protein